MGETLRHGHILGVSAVDVTARGLEVRAQIFVACAAEGARAAGRKDPGDADPVAGLKTVGSGAVSVHLSPLDFIQFGVADPAACNPDQDFAVLGHGLGQFHHLQWGRVVGQAAESVQYHGFHGEASLAWNGYLS